MESQGQGDSKVESSSGVTVSTDEISTGAGDTIPKDSEQQHDEVADKEQNDSVSESFTPLSGNNSDKDSDVNSVPQEENNGSSDQSEFEIIKQSESGDSDSGQRETAVGSEETSKTATEAQSKIETVNTDTTKETVADSEKTDESVMDILGNGLLKKKVLRKGGGRSSRPNHGDIVTLKTEGRLSDGTVIDQHDSISFSLGDGDVIQAWDLAVSLMELEEQCELETAAKYAYGSIGREPDVPADATVTYTLELLKKEESPMLNVLTIQQRISKGESKRERGNYLFSRKDFTGAINSYSKALSILEFPGGSSDGADTATLQEMLDCKLKCYNNLAACQLKIDAYDAAIRSCEGVLKSQPENVKALYRIGKAHGAKGEAQKALPYLKKAVKLDPSSKMIHAELAKLTQKLKKETDSEKQMYRRMLGTTKDPVKKNGSQSWWKMPLMVGGVLAGVVSVGLAVAYRYAQH